MFMKLQMINLLILPGDGYKKQMLIPFINYLKRNNINPLFVQLIENKKKCSYESLDPINYIKYINSKIPLSWNKFTIYSISKGCHWGKVFACKYPKRINKLILVEPTTFNQQLIRKYEKERGNYFIDDLYQINEPFKGISSIIKSLDVIVSDDNKYIPRVPTTIIYTNRDNRNEFYSNEVIEMKNEFVDYLRRNGVKLKVLHIDSQHCADLYPSNFEIIKTEIAK